jgi:hypothetical protein
VSRDKLYFKSCKTGENNKTTSFKILDRKNSREREWRGGQAE